ncbi:MAG: beta-galactosidase [Fimbriimonas sp.]|nr:beta-galactosidase [Fimbriimonas sp.]
MNSYKPISPKLPVLWHGGDYNPEQWPKAVWPEDMRLMDLAQVNVATIGVFSWVSLEPEEGCYQFEWLDEVMDLLYQSGRFAVLATPSAAPPAWMSQKYPEILRVGPDRVRRLHGNRVNFDWSSPVYREKVRKMATVLAERYGSHPALLMWHLSNEYGGASYSEASRQAFVRWLQNKFGGDLDKLNAAYWTSFWGHTFTEWDQIEIPGQPYGETAIHGLSVDWDRFVTDEIVDFFLNESEPFRRITPDVPIATNLMGFYGGLDPWKMVPHLDVIAWDSYPQFSLEPMNDRSWAKVAMTHDLNRSLKRGKPFLLMESTPSSSNWYPVMSLKPPGMHHLEGMQAVAHGSDSVMYFQWRQSRGCQEKFHGAVVGINQGEYSRVFRDVASVGADLALLGDVVGAVSPSQVAIIYDWEVAWAIEHACGPVQKDKGYFTTCLDHYLPLWESGISVDVLSSDCDLSGYKLVIAPMLYMVKPGVAERLTQYVQDGGTLVSTYLTGYVDENDLIFGNGFLGPLRELFGVETEEIDAKFDSETVDVVLGYNELGLDGIFQAHTFCERIHPTTADVIAQYGNVWYAFEPAITVNSVGEGKAIYVASRNDPDFTAALIRCLVSKLDIEPATPFQLPEGVSATKRVNDKGEFLFVLNSTQDTHWIALPATYTELLSGDVLSESLELGPFGVAVLTETA